jgi:hypothetical protein
MRILGHAFDRMDRINGMLWRKGKLPANPHHPAQQTNKMRIAGPALARLADFGDDRNTMKRTSLLLAALVSLTTQAQSIFPLKTETQKEKKVRRILSPPGEDSVLLVQTQARTQ